MKGYSTFPKALALLEPQYYIVWCHIQDTHWGGGYSSEEMQSVHSTVPANLAVIINNVSSETYAFMTFISVFKFNMID